MSKAYQKMTAPTKEQLILEKKSEIKAAVDEYRDEYQRQLEMEERKARVAETRRETILRRMAERALEEGRQEAQSDLQAKTDEERLSTMMAALETVDETKVTKWEGDDDLQKLIDAAVQDAAGSDKKKEGKKKAAKQKDPEETEVSPERADTIVVEEFDLPESGSADFDSAGGKISCSICKVSFKTDAQYASYFVLVLCLRT